MDKGIIPPAERYTIRPLALLSNLTRGEWPALKVVWLGLRRSRGPVDAASFAVNAKSLVRSLAVARRKSFLFPMPDSCLACGLVRHIDPSPSTARHCDTATTLFEISTLGTEIHGNTSREATQIDHEYGTSAVYVRQTTASMSSPLRLYFSSSTGHDGDVADTFAIFDANMRLFHMGCRSLEDSIG